MEILRRTLGLDPDAYRTDAAFVELAFGAWEGLTWKEIRRQDPVRAAARARDKWAFQPPGGGESYAELAWRVGPALARLDQPTVLVSHGGVARALLHLLAGLPREAAPQADIWQGRVLLFAEGGCRWL